MIVTLPVLYLAPLSLVYLVVSLALVARKATLRAKKSATIAYCMISELYQHGLPTIPPLPIIIDAITKLAS